MAMDLPGDKRGDEIDRRLPNVALIDHRLNELAQAMSSGFLRLENKIDGNLESVMERMDRSNERQVERADALVTADNLLAEAMDRRIGLLEGKLNERVLELEKWRVEVEAEVATLADVKEGAVKTKHLWFAAVGVFVAMGGLVVAVAGVVVTILLTS